MKRIYNKLVRDNIPEIIKNSGMCPVFKTLTDDMYIQMLDAKIDEELAEYKLDHSIEELADLLEVIFAVAEARGYSKAELEMARQRKAEERGAFVKKLFLIEVDDNGDD